MVALLRENKDNQVDLKYLNILILQKGVWSCIVVM